MRRSMSWQTRFFTIWTGQLLSLVGSQAAQFALVWWVTKTTGSATVLAMASLVALLPKIVLGPFAGALIDRWNRRLVMLVSDSFVALVSLWLAYLFWTGSMEVWHVYVVMMARSVGGAFHWPAMSASTSLMVPDKHLVRVSGLNQTINGVMALLAPMLGAVLMMRFALHEIMLMDLATALFAVLPLLFVRIPQPDQTHVEAIQKESFWANTREGLRFVFRWPGLLGLIGAAFVAKIALSPAFSLVPLLVSDHFGGEAQHLALLEMLAGIGITAGGLVLGAWGGFKRKAHTMFFGFIGVGLGIGMLGFAPADAYWMGLVGAGLLGFMISLADGPLHALLQATVPAQMQGRVFGVLSSMTSMSAPLGLLMAGPISDWLGICFWFQAAAVLCVTVACVCVLIPSIVRIEDQVAELAPAESTVPVETATD